MRRPVIPKFMRDHEGHGIFCMAGDCMKPAEHGPWLAQYCGEHGKEWIEKWSYAARIKTRHKCPECGSPVITNTSMCGDCEEKARADREHECRLQKYNDAKTIKDFMGLAYWHMVFLNDDNR